MKEFQREKIILLPLHCGNSNTALNGFQRLLLYGLLAKMSLFTDFITKSVFLKEDANGFESRLTPEQRLQAMNQYALNSRSRYILSGALVPRLDGQQLLKSIRVSFRLYDSLENRLLIDVVNTFSTFEPGKNTLQDIEIPIQDMNGVLNWILVLITNVMTPEKARHCLGHMAAHELTSSLDGLKSLVRAEEVEELELRIKIYEQAVAMDPKLEYAYSQLGKLCRIAGRFEESIQYYQKAFQVTQCPDKTKALYSTEIGIGCALLGRHDVATQWWLKSIEMAPRFINPYMNVALTYEERGELDKAESYYLKAQAIEPEDQRTYFGLGAIYQKMGAWKQAIEQYKQYLTKEDTDPWCHNEVATCYLQMGDQINAATHLEKTKNLDPNGEYGQYAQLILTNLSHV